MSDRGIQRWHYTLIYTILPTLVVNIFGNDTMTIVEVTV